MKLLLFCIIGTAFAIRLPAAAVNVSAPAQAGTVTAAGNSFNPTFSADGHHLVFVSHANNLVTNDSVNPWLDVFMRDLVTSNTVLVSVSASGFGGANADANYPSVSSNGQFIAFASRASNLVPGDTNDGIDVFVREMVAGTTRLVSVDVNGAAPVDPVPSSVIPLAGNPMISADGRWVFFESRATNLVAGGALADSVNIYRRDTLLNTTVLVTADTNGNAVSGTCELTSITPDGRYAAFITTNRSLAADVTPTAATVYLRDVNLSTTVWVGYVPGVDEQCVTALVSEDAKYVVFMTTGTSNAVVRREVSLGSQVIGLFATNSTLSISADANRVAFESGGYAQLWAYDTNGATSPAPVFQSNASAKPVLSRDGQSLAFIEATSPAATQWQLYLYTSPTNILPVSLNATGGPSAADFFFSEVAVNGDGSRIAFDSTASDLVPGDLNGASDIFLRDVNAGVMELITQAVPSKPAAAAFAHSFLGQNSISANGRFVVFTRYDDPSAYRDTNGWQDVFVNDVVNGLSVAVSINSNTYATNLDGGAEPMVTLIENTNSYERPIISGDGTTIVASRTVPSRFVAVARSSNDVFGTSGMLAISRRPDGNSGDADSPSVSDDGAIVAFRSTPQGSSSPSDIFVHFPTAFSNGFLQGSNQILSVAPGGNAANGLSVAPVVSPDGAWAVFGSTAGNLVPALQVTSSGTYSYYQLFLAFFGTNRSGTNFLQNVPKHLATYTTSTEAVQVFTGEPPATNTHWNTLRSPLPVHATNAFFSADSRYAFLALADGSGVLRQELMTFHTNVVRSGSVMTSNGLYPRYVTNVFAGAVTTLACTNCGNPSVSADGNIIAFERRRLQAGTFDSFAVDLLTGIETLVSVNSVGSAPANASSTSPLLRGDGRYVVFQSQASDLVANDTNGANDIFVRDRLLDVTMVVSANAQGRPGNGPSTRPVMAADGRTVVFQSFASDLVTGDYNDKRDLFVVKLGGADTDGDGMDDDWEVAYFGNLSRNGSDDIDKDGATDLAEFLAGTDPTNSNSVFRVLTVAPAGGGNTLVLWTGNPTLSYRAEFKDDLGVTTWTPLTGTISWNGSTASIPDVTATNSAHRYYRVVRLP